MTAATTTHEQALAIAGAAPAFRMTQGEERELRDHLRTCADCTRRVARMRADLDAIGRVDPAVSARLHDRIREVAVTPRRSGTGIAGLLIVFLLLSLGTIGAAMGVGALEARPAAPPADARLDVLPANPANPANAGNGRKPAQFGDELACTGILQQPPAIADVRLQSLGYKVDWRWQFATGPNTGQSQVVEGPPQDGYISGTAPGPSGTIVVFVEDPTNPSMPRLERPATCLLP
jgi:hypothetical protein